MYFTEAIEEYRGVLYSNSKIVMNRSYSTKGFATGIIQAYGNPDFGGFKSGYSPNFSLYPK